MNGVLDCLESTLFKWRPGERGVSGPKMWNVVQMWSITLSSFDISQLICICKPAYKSALSFIVKYILHSSQCAKYRFLRDHTGLISSDSSARYVVQSLNSPFFPPHIGAEPGRAKEESRITCMRMLRTNQSKITRSQPRCSRQCVAQCLSQLALWKKTFSLALILS